MRKQRKPLDLILTALLPVAVLSIGFFTFSLRFCNNSWFRNRLSRRIW